MNDKMVDDYEEEYGSHSTYDPDTNIVYVREKRCETCIFTNKRPVSQARVNQLVREADAAESCIPCHKHLYVGEDIHPVCRGYFDRHSSMTLRLAEMMGIVEFV